MSVTQASASSAGSGYRSAILADKPIAYYLLSDSGSQLVDAGPQHINGNYGSLDRLAQAPLTLAQADAVAMPGGAYNAAAFAHVPPAAALQPQTLSVEAWISRSQSTSSAIEPVLSYGAQAPSGLPYTLQLMPSGQIKWRIRGAAPSIMWSVTGRTVLASNKPHHIVGTFSGSQLVLYIDGVEDGSGAAPGPIKYNTGAAGNDGLAIGGEEAGGRNNFAGMISNVAIYGSVLSSESVASHYKAAFTAAAASSTPTPKPVPTIAPTSHPVAPPAPTAAPIATLPPGVSYVSEQSKSAFSFTDSLGFDSHFDESSYRNSFDQITAGLLAIPAFHIRDGESMPQEGTGYPELLRQLCARGIKHSISWPLTVAPSTIIASINAYGPQCVDYVEPLNEADGVAGYGSRDPNWPAEVVAETRTIYNTIKSVPAFSKIVVAGPALARATDYYQVGNLESISDVGNQHDATCDGNPGTHAYRTLQSRLAFEQFSYPTKPIWVTETAYNDYISSSDHCAIPDDIIAKYMPRTQTERFNLGQPRIYWYQLADLPNDPMFGNEGLMTHSGGIKVQYTAMQSLMQALQDGRSASASTLKFAIDDPTGTVHHTLLRKSNGKFDLLLWNETPDWDTVKHVRITVPARQVSIFLPASTSSVTQTQYGTDWKMYRSSLMTKAGQVSATVNDTVSILEF